MVLLLTLSYFLTFVSLVTSLVLSLALVRQRVILKQLEGELRLVRREKLDSFQSALEPELEHPVLEGLKVGLFIRQDNERPVFAALLKDRFTEEDAFPAIASETDDEAAFDLIVKGTVTCNSYAETYYSADIDCYGREGAILSLTEKPPQGGRQVNLANELVKRLKREMEEDASRRERMRAISQLRGELP